MSWRPRRSATRATGPRGPGVRVRWALVASLAVHGALGWLLLGKPTPRSATLPDVVEVSFEVDEPASEPAASPAGEGSAPAAGVAWRARAAPERGGAARLGATAARAEADAMPTTNGDGATPAANGEGPVAKAPAPGDSAAGAADRLSTFRPAHPDLLGAGKGPMLDEKPRDLLASPLAKAPAGPRDLPRVLRGSGGVTARVGDDGSIHFGGPKDVVLNDSPFQDVGGGAGVGLGGSLDVTD